jgi:DHA1 family tetracycline resistance protein-like MFS transporter
MLTAILSQRVPENAQGELQGGISAITNLAMLAGTVFFAQIFGWSMAADRANPSPDLPFYVAGAGLVLTLAAMVWATRRAEA